MGRPIVHWELMSEDPAKVSAFYEKIFGGCGNRLRSNEDDLPERVRFFVFRPFMLIVMNSR